MYKKYVKRILDLMISIIGMPFFLLVFIVIAPIIYFSDKGPVFYNADRIGKKGKVFKMYKFRSMKVDAPDIRLPDGSTYNSADDPRVTKIGKIIRKTSVDELPQILNVFLGDMSWIGPRPNLPTVSYAELDEPHRHRLDVKPGITGYNQAYFRNSVSAEQRTINDNYYVNNLSFFLDVKILIRTIISVIKKDNIYISEKKR